MQTFAQNNQILGLVIDTENFGAAKSKKSFETNKKKLCNSHAQAARL
jgi:hypothetical protein